MTLLSFLGLDLFFDPDSRLTNSAYEEYYGRYERIKEYIEAIPEIKSNINTVFSHEYLKKPLQDSILLLGKGPRYSTYSIYNGGIPDGEHDISLALRIKRIREGDGRVHKLQLDDGMIDVKLFSELDSFYSAFAKNVNLPYFTGLVQWIGPGQYSDGAVGFLTEDLTKRKTLHSRQHNEMFVDTLKVTGADGKVNTYFVNAVMAQGYSNRVLKCRKDPVIVHHDNYPKSYR